MKKRHDMKKKDTRLWEKKKKYEKRKKEEYDKNKI